MNVLRTDPNSKAFGLSSIALEPMKVKARLLPQAQLVYGNNLNVDPKITGAW